VFSVAIKPIDTLTVPTKSAIYYSSAAMNVTIKNIV
jgi:hypothetical protein